MKNELFTCFAPECVAGKSLLLHLAAEAVFDVVVQDEIQFLRREAVVPRQHLVYFVEDGFT